MNATQINLIRRTYAKISLQTETFAEIFYKNLFTLQPALRLLFSGDFSGQKQKLMQMLDVMIELLDEPEKLIPVLEESGRRHALYGVRDEHYETVGKALFKTLAEILGADFTAVTEIAWTQLYNFISDTLKRGAFELSRSPDKYREKNTEKKIKILKPTIQTIGFVTPILFLTEISLAQTTAASVFF